MTTWQIEPLGEWGRPITRDRASRGRFRAGWTDTVDLLLGEAEQLGVRGAIALRIDAQRGDIRRDGMLRANARVAFPGVALSFVSRHGALTYATDAYDGWQANVRAIALSLQALRAVDRYGVSRSGEQYAGWRAIAARPTPFASAAEAIAWLREVTGIANPAVSPGPLLRRAAATLHPDANGGDHSGWERYDQARQIIEAQGRPS